MPKRIQAEDSKMLFLGHAGENDAVQIVFDVETLSSQYAQGEFHVIHQRACDDVGYPCQILRNGNQVIWEVKSTDTAVPGQGKCELRFTLGETVIKSVLYSTWVEESLTAGEEPPDPWREWVEEVLNAAEEIRSAVAPTFSMDEQGHLCVSAGGGESTDLGSVKGEVGPQGPKGDKGDTGETGATGAQGPKGDKGETGAVGSQGAAGAAGKSAYASAQDGGYTGNEVQFNTDLAAVGSKQSQHITQISTLTAAGWSNNQQTVSVTGVTASSTIIVSPDPSSVSDYGNTGIYASAQGAGTLTFACSTTPTAAITVNVAIFN